MSRQDLSLRLTASFFTLIMLLALAHAQTQTKATSPSAEIPRLIKFNGIARDESGKPMSGVVGITFYLYKNEQGGAPLWLETQNVQADANGGYTVMLGTTKPDGLPLDLFTSGEARWLEVRIGEQEQARVLLVSVPYAIKAHEAETLAGRSISDFVLNDSQMGTVTHSDTVSAIGHSSTSSATPPPPAGPTNFSGSNTTQIVGVTQSGSGTGVNATSTTHAALAGTITGAINTAVYGLASNTASGSTAAGVTGASNTQLGPGVQGVTSSPKGLGVQGVVNTTSGGTAVQGLNRATTGVSLGVEGQTSSVTTNSSGVLGIEAAKTGQVYGVSGNTNSTGPYAAAVSGFEGASTGQVFGVNGGTNSPTNGSAGVNGSEGATTGAVYGVFGSAQSSTTNAMGVGGYEGAKSGQVYAVDGYTTSTGPFAAGVGGFEGATTGQVFGVAGGASSTTNGSAGVNGNENATSGVVYGVSGGTSSATANAAGVNGFAGAATGQVYGVNGNTRSTGPYAAALNGYEGATTGRVFGVSGSTPSTSGVGVSGFASATSGQTDGVQGTSASPNGNGVLGDNNATTGFAVGVTGVTNSPNGAGINGFSNTSSGGIGVIGTAPTSGTAVMGINQVCPTSPCTPVKGVAGLFTTGIGGTILLGTSGSSFSTATTKFSVDSSGNGFYAGNLSVSGTLSKGSGSFKIDDPLDPAKKYLSHSFVESPDMMNVYNGNITTNKRGVATVVLPDYFEALNRDFRYQLTVIGEFAQAIVAKKIANNRFVIRTNKPQVEVSWQVTGIRHDAYANAHRIPIEEDKPANEQGYYLHPELFGQPESKSIAAAQKTRRQEDVLAHASQQ